MKVKSRLAGMIATTFIAGLALAPPAALAGDFLGCGPVEFPASGYYRAEQSQGRWWLVTPDGRRFLSLGVNHIQYHGYDSRFIGYSPYQHSVQELYGGSEGWARATQGRLRDWGFNTLGSWSMQDAFPPMPYTLTLNLSQLGGGNWLTGTFPDVFDPGWEKAVKDECKKVCGPRKDDPYLIGYFTDNELHWGPDWRGTGSLLDLFLALPDNSPGGKRAREFLKMRENSGRREREELFAREVARQYFSVTTAAIREADAHHMVLGCRFHALSVPTGVAAEAGKYLDVVSINYYDMLPLVQNLLIRALGNVSLSNNLGDFARVVGKPVLLTEFSYRAMDSGLPNTKGAGDLVLTQRQRADRFERYARSMISAPYIVGYHWFNYMDEPFWGREPDGENGNYGLVDGKDRPYVELTGRMKQINGQACELHENSRPH